MLRIMGFKTPNHKITIKGTKFVFIENKDGSIDLIAQGPGFSQHTTTFTKDAAVMMKNTTKKNMWAQIKRSAIEGLTFIFNAVAVAILIVIALTENIKQQKINEMEHSYPHSSIYTICTDSTGQIMSFKWDIKKIEEDSARIELFEKVVETLNK